MPQKYVFEQQDLEPLILYASKKKKKEQDKNAQRTGQTETRKKNIGDSKMKKLELLETSIEQLMKIINWDQIKRTDLEKKHFWNEKPAMNKNWRNLEFTIAQGSYTFVYLITNSRS